MILVKYRAHTQQEAVAMCFDDILFQRRYSADRRQTVGKQVPNCLARQVTDGVEET